MPFLRTDWWKLAETEEYLILKLNGYDVATKRINLQSVP